MVFSCESHTNALFLIKRHLFKTILDEEIVVFFYIPSTNNVLTPYISVAHLLYAMSQYYH